MIRSCICTIHRPKVFLIRLKVAHIQNAIPNKLLFDLNCLFGRKSPVQKFLFALWWSIECLNVFFFVSIAEFQEAFNLFDNRGDGKIQLNQVSWLFFNTFKKSDESLNSIVFYLQIFLFHLFCFVSLSLPTRLANVCVHWARIQLNQMWKSVRTNLKPMSESHSKYFCQFIMLFRRLVPAIRPTISLRVCAISIRMQVVLFQQPNYDTYWPRWARSSPTMKSNSC